MNPHPGIGALVLLIGVVTLIASGCAGDGPRSSTAIYLGAQSTTATVLGVPLQPEGHVQSGRGVVVKPGVVATACHVIEHSRAVVVLEERLPAEVVDSAADLCLMSIESEHSGLRPIELGRAHELRAGETVYLIGSAGWRIVSLPPGRSWAWGRMSTMPEEPRPFDTCPSLMRHLS